MRKINGKLFLGLLLGTALLAGAVFAVHAFQYQRIARALLWQARRAEEQGQVERMTRYLSRYLEFNPRDDVEKAHLATAWAGDGFANAPRVRLRAVRLLDEVLTRDGNRPDLRRLLVKTALELGQTDRARTHLEKLLPWEQVSKAAGEPGARGEPGALATGEIDRERGELEGYWGHLLDAEGKPGEAMACCRLAVRHAPEGHPSYVRLAYLLRRRKEVDPARRERDHHEADALLDTLVAKNPTAHLAYLARWRYRRDFDLLELKAGEPAAGRVTLTAAAQDVADALKRAPEAVEVLLAAADLERLLGQAAYEDPRLTPAAREKALAEHRDLAYEHLQRGLKLQDALPARAASDAARFQLLWHKASLLLDDLKLADGRRPGDPAAARPEQVSAWETEAAQTLEELRKTRVSPAGGDFLQGRLLVHERRWAEAAALFEHASTLLSGQVDLAVQINLHLGQCYEQLEEPSQMISAYQRVLVNDPASAPALLGLAAAEWSLQRLDSAAGYYQQLIALGKVPDKAWQDIARLQIQRLAQSASRERERPEGEPRTPATGAWSRVEEALATAARATPDAVEVPLLEAEMWVVRKDETRAADILTRARAKHPGEPELWVAEADLALRGKDRAGRKRALAVLDAARDKVGDVVLLRLARARALAAGLPRAEPGVLATGGSAEERQAVRDGINALADGADKFNEEDQGRLLGGLAYVHLDAGDLASAREWWQKVARMPRYRTDLRLRLLLFDLALRLDDEDGIAQALTEVRAVERREGTFSRYAEALRLLWRVEKKGEDQTRALSEARLLLESVRAQRPNWPAVYLARSRVSETEGNFEEAIKDLREARDRGENSPEVVRHLVDLLSDRGRNEEADQELKRAGESVLARDPNLERLGALLLLKLGKFDEAARKARKTFNPETANYKELVLQGRMLAETDPADAERHLKRASSIAPEEPVVWIARAQFLGFQNLKARQRNTQPADLDAAARRLLEEARTKLPPEKVALTEGQCWEVLGRQKEASEAFEKALAQRRDDLVVVRAAANFYLGAGLLQKAEPLLQRIVDRDLSAASAGDREWARHGLALVLASGTDYERFRKALELEGLQLDEAGQLLYPGRPNGESTEQQKSRARVLATQLGQRQFRKRAIEMLEGLNRNRALLPSDRYILAVLYEADRAYTKAQEILADLVEKGRTHSPQYVARYIHVLLMRGNLDEAQRWTDRLRQTEDDLRLVPNSFASLEMQARIWEARGQGDKALAMLQQHVRREGARPDEVLLVLDSLRRQKRYAEAYRECEKMWDGKCSPEVCGGASVAVLRMATPTDEQVKLLETRLKAAVTKADDQTRETAKSGDKKAADRAKDRSMVLRLHLADLYDLRGRYADAEGLYRQVIDEKNEPKNVVALNNLAWLLGHREGGAAEALSCIQAAVGGIGRRADLLDTRGWVYLKMGRPDDALADFKEATDEDPTPTRLFHLAKVYADKKDPVQAAGVLKKAQELVGPASKGTLPNFVHPTEQAECRRLLAELKLQ
jgi:tetratricopeptide (TPR) repeat protein